MPIAGGEIPSAGRSREWRSRADALRDFPSLLNAFRALDRMILLLPSDLAFCFRSKGEKQRAGPRDVAASQLAARTFREPKVERAKKGGGTGSPRRF